jgi:hypothetical protein
MWQTATCYKSAIFAALVASSLALLTGAQAEELSLANASTPSFFSFNSSGFAGQPGLTMSLGAMNGTASFDALTGGTYNCTCINVGVGGFNSADPGSFNLIGGQGSSILRATFAGGNTLTAFLSLSTIINAVTSTPTVFGTYSRSNPTTGGFASTGVFASGGSFPQTGPIFFTLNTGTGPTLSDLMLNMGGSTTPTITSGGLNLPVPPEVPLPPAIYLFGSVLGGAFWLSRRKRSAVSSPGAA